MWDPLHPGFDAPVGQHTVVSMAAEVYGGADDGTALIAELLGALSRPVMQLSHLMWRATALDKAVSARSLARPNVGTYRQSALLGVVVRVLRRWELAPGTQSALPTLSECLFTFGQISASAQCTPGDPVLLPAESKQLAYDSLIDQSQFLVQDKLYLHAWIDPQKSYTLASVLAVDTTPGMQRVFWGNSPSTVIVGPEADKDQMFRVADCVARLHTALVQLSVVILSPPEGLDDANFILSAIEFHKGLPESINPERIWRAYRVVSRTAIACQSLPRVVVSTPPSRVTTRRPAYKKFSLMTPGQDPTVDWFTPVDVPQKMLAIMFHKQWEQELMTFLGTEPRNEVVVPGPDVQHTRILFKELDLTRVKSLDTQLGRRPRFAVMPVLWYKGSAMKGKPYQLSAFLRREEKIDHAPFLFSYVLAAFWDMGEVLGVSSEIALRSTAYNQVRVGLTKAAMEYFRPHMMRLNESVGLVVVDEASGEWLTDSDVDASSTASTIPDTWGQVTSVNAINVPPWYDQKAVHSM